MGDVLDMPLVDGSVDLATDRGCLHYLDHENRVRYARELSRLLRPGGLVLIRGMSQPERYKTAVNEEAVRSIFTPPAFEIVDILPFTMVGTKSHAPATLALVTRT